ncbi:MAG TPA: hypothetical protein VEZ15_12045 [Acidimicrobiia bacterium]|nr:hypothetical protein [Acidimicrobiia bacterium]
MKTPRKAVLVSMVLGSMATGGLLGATVLAPSSSSAATTSTTASSGAAAPSGTSATGTCHSNENAAHEKTESAAREAQENAGQMPTIP